METEFVTDGQSYLDQYFAAQDVLLCVEGGAQFGSNRWEFDATGNTAGVKMFVLPCKERIISSPFSYGSNNKGGLGLFSKEIWNYRGMSLFGVCDGYVVV